MTMSRAFSFSIAVISLFTLSAPAEAAPTLRYRSASFVSAANIGVSGYVVYSPTTVKSGPALPKLWFGGWMTKGEMPADNIYVADFTNSKVKSAPQAISWYNPNYPKGHPPDYHVNDPSVVFGPDPAYPFYFLYYTALCADYLYGCPKELGNRPLAEPETKQMFKRNWVGAAASFDQGKSWVDLGVILGQDNGFDNSGAWSPSALVREKEVWLYYHTNPYPCENAECSTSNYAGSFLMRTRLEGNGWQQIKTERLLGPGGQPISGISNVDVQYAFGKYWLIGERFIYMGEDKPADTQLVLFLSADGINFQPFNGGDAVVYHPRGLQFITAHILPKTAHSFEVQFGFSRNYFKFGPEGSKDTHLARWNFRLNP